MAEQSTMNYQRKAETMAKKTKTEVAKAKQTAVSETVDYGADVGSGFEDTTGKDLSVPFINYLQSNSPEVQKCDDGTIRIGMMKNTVTGEIIDGKIGINFLPVHKEEAFVEWIPRLQGGGFVALHDPQSDQVQAIIEANGGRMPKKDADGKKIPLKIGDNELVETYYVYGLILDKAGEETEGFCVIAFTSTKIKPYRDWLTSMYLLKGKPPMFANRAIVKADVVTNDAGTFGIPLILPLRGTWVESLIPPGAALLDEARDFREMVVKGMARADFKSQRDERGDGGDSGTGADPTHKGEKVPF